MTDRAAALTYYSLMSLFPALLFAVAVLGVFGRQALITRRRRLPQDRRRAGGHGRLGHLRARVRADAARARRSPRSSLGLALSLNGASGAFGAVGRALNRVWRVEEGRGFVRKKANDLAVDARRPRARDRHLRADLPRRRARRRRARPASASGRPPPTSGGSSAGRLALASAMLVYAVVYFAAPNVEVRRFRWITPGAVFGVIDLDPRLGPVLPLRLELLVLLGHLRRVRGAVILLVWLWLTNVVLLFGAELNAAIDLRRSPGSAARLRGPAAARQGAGRLRRPRRPVAASSPPATSTARARPGHSPHSSRCGVAATGHSSASTPRGEPQQRVGQRRRVRRAERGAHRLVRPLGERVGDLDARARRPAARRARRPSAGSRRRARSAPPASRPPPAGSSCSRRPARVPSASRASTSMKPLISGPPPSGSSAKAKPASRRTPRAAARRAHSGEAANAATCARTSSTCPASSTRPWPAARATTAAAPGGSGPGEVEPLEQLVDERAADPALERARARRRPPPRPRRAAARRAAGRARGRGRSGSRSWRSPAATSRRAGAGRAAGGRRAGPPSARRAGPCRAPAVRSRGAGAAASGGSVAAVTSRDGDARPARTARSPARRRRGARRRGCRAARARASPAAGRRAAAPATSRCRSRPTGSAAPRRGWRRRRAAAAPRRPPPRRAPRRSRRSRAPAPGRRRPAWRASARRRRRRPTSSRSRPSAPWRPRSATHDHRELEALGAVDRHEPHGVQALGLERGLALARLGQVLPDRVDEEAAQVAALRALVLARQPHQLAQVRQPAVAAGAGEDREVVAGRGDRALQQHLDRAAARRAAARR